jgi:hypothetical protein
LKIETQTERKSSVESSRCKGEWNWNENSKIESETTKIFLFLGKKT